MQEKKKWSPFWLFFAVLCLILAAVLIVYILRHSALASPKVDAEQSMASTIADIPMPSLTPPVIDQTPSPQSGETELGSTEENGAEVQAAETETYKSPVDFEALWAVNEDIIAWLYIPGASISLPILQDPENNAYYLTHDVQRQESSSGALFIEDYNRPDFNDMCTIVYGHRMYSGAMFGTLQSTYSDETTFSESQDIVVYLPDREIVYQVFAAVPYDNTHILYYHDFDDQLSYRKFINSIYSTTGIGTTLEEELKPQYGEKLLILSTCLWGDKDNRYLVLAKERSA